MNPNYFDVFFTINIMVFLLDEMQKTIFKQTKNKIVPTQSQN